MDVIAKVSTDYPKRPAHRGHAVEVQGWNDVYVLLVIRSGEHTAEALMTPAELTKLAKAATENVHLW